MIDRPETGDGGGKTCRSCYWWRGRAYVVHGETKRSCVKLQMLTEAGYPNGECSMWEEKA